MQGFHHIEMDAFLAVADTAKNYTQEAGSRWNGGVGYKGNRDRCVTGDASLADKAASVLERIEASGIIKRGTLGYVQDVCGEFPNVPAFLAGDVECMMRKGETEMATDRSPLKVFIGVGAGANWTADELINRGVYVMALVQLLSERRAVELFWYCAFGNGNDKAKPIVPIVPMNTRPLDLSTAAHIIASAGFFRTVAFAFQEAKGGSHGYIPWTWNEQTLSDRFREGLGAEPTDLVVHSGANQSVFRDRPEDWLIDQLKQYAPDMLA